MGNRVYITATSAGLQRKTYYLHWNGCMLTWAPLCKALFELGVTKLADLEGALKHLDLRFEEVESNNESMNWVEENGHLFVDLGKKTLTRRFEVHNKATDIFDVHSELVTDFKAAFERRLESYRPEARDHKRETNWTGIQDEVRKVMTERRAG